jgi:hypothetical protein
MFGNEDRTAYFLLSAISYEPIRGGIYVCIRLDDEKGFYGESGG